ncbi:Hypothetical protein containing citrate transporter-like domain [Thermococcus paralvinellae]|uniref:Citrate transporter-like domain-containing protein n=2 Tax=Thermococcus paralvinellae TaxID=582419 RepID=W0I730_9EURY|nr:Hypothetical protein containing citrate transporter-like domain [Thermococcus paralvinellae]
MRNPIARKFMEEWLLTLTLVGLVITSLYLERFPSYSKNDFKVIFTLFVFLVIIRGLERSGFLYSIASKVEKGRHLSLKLIFLTALLSMFMTNDVALLTIVPLTLALNVENKGILVILETITANGASSLTPFGNPQNIFIYYHYHVHPWEFIRTIAPFTFASLIFVLFIAYTKAKIRGYGREIANFDKKAYHYLFFFVLFILAVLRVLPLEVGILPVIYSLLFDMRALFIDYFLLATFLAFFGFTDNLMHILSFNLQNSTQVFLYSSLASQVISNVPSALLFADFTSDWRALLWGVSVGGYGTLISSLANLISYRLYRAYCNDSKSYLLRFHFYNFLAFLMGILVYFIFVMNHLSILQILS